MAVSVKVFHLNFFIFLVFDPGSCHLGSFHCNKADSLIEVLLGLTVDDSGESVFALNTYVPWCSGEFCEASVPHSLARSGSLKENIT